MKGRSDSAAGGIIEIIHAPQVGGAEMLALMLGEAWHRQGRSVRICCLYGRGGPLERTIVNKGIPCDLLDIESQAFPARWLSLFNYFRRHRPRAVHVHHMGLLINVLPAAYLSGCKNVVVTEHSMLYLLRHPRLRRLLPLLASGVAKVVCVSERLRDFLIGQRVSPAKATTIYNGIDTVKFSPKDGARSGILTIGSVGRLVEEKDYENLLHALALLKGNGLRFESYIVGEGPLSGELRELKEKLDLSAHVHFLGGREDIPELLRSFDIYVLSSKSEGLPIALLEAMAIGLPIVATDVGGVGEVIRHDGNGLLVESGDPRALAEAIERLAGDRVLRARLGEAALSDARARYSIAATVEQYTRVLQC